MQNLIENAAKFMGRQARPVVEIGRHATPSGNATFVRDNGMGIEAATQDRIFELFQRLHPEIEGTGVGLTLAKKIVDLHDGQIWLESAGIGHGTTFFVRLPDEPSKALPRSG
jgi:signal transduction histidine kinase